MQCVRRRLASRASSASRWSHAATTRAQSTLGLLGLPYDASSSYMRGPAAAPNLIREAFENDCANTWSEQGFDIGGAFDDLGDVMLKNAEDPEAAASDIESAVEQALSSHDLLVSLGGDHSVTYPVLCAMARRHPKLSVLHFDAHPDLYDTLPLIEDGQPCRLSHGSPLLRIVEEGLAQRVVQVGIRTMNAAQRSAADRYGIEVVTMKDFVASPQRTFEFDGPVYISLDLDVMDPAFVPGISHHEPGGMTTREVLTILQGVQGHVIGGDVVEYNPTRDVNGVTAMVAAKVMKEMMCRMLHPPT